MLHHHPNLGICVRLHVLLVHSFFTHMPFSRYSIVNTKGSVSIEKLTNAGKWESDSDRPKCRNIDDQYYIVIFSESSFILSSKRGPLIISYSGPGCSRRPRQAEEASTPPHSTTIANCNKEGHRGPQHPVFRTVLDRRSIFADTP